LPARRVHGQGHLFEEKERAGGKSARRHLRAKIVLRESLTATIFSSLMRNRNAAIAICLIGMAQVGLVALGLKGWLCPFLFVTGCPCPGCGLSRAAVAWLRGEWRFSLTLHAFAPILLAAISLLGFSCLLPAPLHHKLCGVIEKIERRTGFTAILLVGLLVYWLIRLFFVPASLALVVQR
jgi:hypothetical protein